MRPTLSLPTLLASGALALGILLSGGTRASAGPDTRAPREAPEAEEILRAAAVTPPVVAAPASHADLLRVGGDSPAGGTAPAAGAKGGESGGADLSKQSQNPIADLISLPFQNNTYFGVGPDDHVQNVLNIQPVIPVKLNACWNLINRAIIPVAYLEQDTFPGQDATWGLGDITYQGFFSPRGSGDLTWGVGPVFVLPTATEDVFGWGKWCAGPAAVVVWMPGHWVIGALATNVWSFAGDEDRPDVDFLTVQPFVNYNLPCGWFLSSAPIITANWEAPSDQRWTVPLGGGFGRVFKIGRQPVSATVQAYYNVERPDGAAEWQFRAVFALLFPKK